MLSLKVGSFVIHPAIIIIIISVSSSICCLGCLWVVFRYFFVEDRRKNRNYQEPDDFVDEVEEERKKQEEISKKTFKRKIILQPIPSSRNRKVFEFIKSTFLSCQSCCRSNAQVTSEKQTSHQNIEPEPKRKRRRKRKAIVQQFSLDKPIPETEESEETEKDEEEVDIESEMSILEITKPEFEIPEGTSLLEIEEMNSQKREYAIAIRKVRRLEWKSASRSNNVSSNVGPPQISIPLGLFMDEGNVDLQSPSSLLQRRIMYFWEESDSQLHCPTQAHAILPNRWYVGTITGPSTKPNCNVNIKFDRDETGSIFLDGSYATYLGHSGLSAQFRKWAFLVNANGSPAIGKPPPRVQRIAVNSRSTLLSQASISSIASRTSLVREASVRSISSQLSQIETRSNLTLR